MLNCPYCGLTNRPYHTHCAMCERELQDKETAAEKEKDWNGLPTKIREEYEEDYYKAREKNEEYRAWLRRNRIQHSIIGALTLVVFMLLGTLGQAMPMAILDLFLGAAAALWLNRIRGGPWNGLGLFAGAAFVSLVVRAPFVYGEAFKPSYITIGLCLMFVCAIGYYMGMKLGWEHHERMIHG